MTRIPESFALTAAGVPRLGDYFGVWAIEETCFRKQVACFNQINLHAHMMQPSSSPRANAASSRYETVGDVGGSFGDVASRAKARDRSAFLHMEANYESK